jgi:signal transduction histidine kinase
MIIMEENLLQHTILIIDDNPTNLGVMVGYLEKEQIEVITARDGEEGIERAEYVVPDLILLDVMMPGIDGFETCRRLKANQVTKDIPVIFMTALTSQRDKVKGFEAGAVDYVTKPIQQPEMLARIRTHLRLRELTRNLEKKVKELSELNTELKATQTQLVEAEKMAALGSLVAGVAHEINTPVGMGIAAISTLAEETRLLAGRYKGGTMKRSTLEAYIRTSLEGCDLITANLQQAAKLVQSFKKVAIDQSSSQKREFLLKNYLKETLLNLMPLLRKTKHRLIIKGSPTIKLDSYPGALSQIVTNLVTNSIHHAYQPNQSGELRFHFMPDHDRVMIEYSDDGCGIPAENLTQIFEPFFTTARSQGGTGLGLHIVYNLVTQKLKGAIHCESQVGVGSKFILNLPQETPAN